MIEVDHGYLDPTAELIKTASQAKNNAIAPILSIK